jgi:hypothetical protein
MSTPKDWVRATLREEVSGAKKGQIVAMRKSELKLAVGPTWWLVVWETRQVIHLAESYGGHEMYRVAKKCNPLSGPGPKTLALLESLVSTFEKPLKGPLPLRGCPKKSIKRSVSIR